MLRLSLALKAGFHPDQPRIPPGRPDGGQWVRVPGYAQVHRVLRRRASGGQIRIGGRSHPITPAQEAQFAQSYGAMRSALRVRELDPTWRPPAQAYSSVEGLISANRAIELEARFRIFQLLRTRAELGLHAREWIPAPPTNRRLHRSEQRELDNIGGNGLPSLRQHKSWNKGRLLHRRPSGAKVDGSADEDLSPLRQMQRQPRRPLGRISPGEL